MTTHFFGYVFKVYLSCFRLQETTSSKQKLFIQGNIILYLYCISLGLISTQIGTLAQFLLPNFDYKLLVYRSQTFTKKNFVLQSPKFIARKRWEIVGRHELRTEHPYEKSTPGLFFWKNKRGAQLRLHN
jgi:hypothetical protein